MSDIAVEEKVDPRVFRACCGRFATGVTVITTRSDEGDHGMTASAFMSVSLDPPLISISLDRRSKMLGRVLAARRFAVNILTETMRAHALHFAGRQDDTLTDLFVEHHHDLPVLRGAAAVIVADVEKQVEAGDHVLLIGHVRHLDRDPAAAPLVYHAGQFGSLAAHSEG